MVLFFSVFRYDDTCEWQTYLEEVYPEFMIQNVHISENIFTTIFRCCIIWYDIPRCMAGVSVVIRRKLFSIRFSEYTLYILRC